MRVESHVHIGRARRGLVDCISTRDLPTGRVRHTTVQFLSGVSFAVQPAGREKAVANGVKNVHAFVRGELINEFLTDHLSTEGDWLKAQGWREGGYRPQVGYFYDKGTMDPIVKADHAILVGKALWYR